MSGLSRTPGKRVWANPHRGFESRPLRQDLGKRGPSRAMFRSLPSRNPSQAKLWLSPRLVGRDHAKPRRLVFRRLRLIGHVFGVRHCALQALVPELREVLRRWCIKVRVSLALAPGARVETLQCGAPEPAVPMQPRRFGSGPGACAAGRDRLQRVEVSPALSGPFVACLLARASSPGANRGERLGSREDLQRRHRPKGAASYAAISGAPHQVSRTMPELFQRAAVP